MFSPARILIVDSSAESRDVLRTVLERMGAETIEARQVSRAIGLAHQSRPDVIVLDAEGDNAPSSEAVGELCRTASHSSTPIVVLGTQKRCERPLATGHFISKPYQYATLIRRIEELLGNRK